MGYLFRRAAAHTLLTAGHRYLLFVGAAAANPQQQHNVM